MDELTKLLGEMQARCEAATEGPWAWAMTGDKSNDAVVGTCCDKDGRPLSGLLDNDDDFDVLECVAEKINDAHFPDFAFIAAARSDLPRLIAGFRVAVEGLAQCIPAMESAWYELEPGPVMLGDQFIRQDHMRERIEIAQQALSLARSKLAGGG